MLKRHDINTDTNNNRWRWTLASTPDDVQDNSAAPSILYSDDAAMLLSSLTEDQRAVLADCNQMRNFGRPGYEHEWAPTEHQASAALATSSTDAQASPLALAEAWSEDLLQKVWPHPQINTEFAEAGAIVVGFVAVVALVVTRIYVPSPALTMASFEDEDDDFDPDDVYHPLL